MPDCQSYLCNQLARKAAKFAPFIILQLCISETTSLGFQVGSIARRCTQVLSLALKEAQASLVPQKPCSGLSNGWSPLIIRHNSREHHFPDSHALAKEQSHAVESMGDLYDQVKKLCVHLHRQQCRRATPC